MDARYPMSSALGPLSIAAILSAATAVGPLQADPPPLVSLDEPRFNADIYSFHDEGRSTSHVWLAVHVPTREIFFDREVNEADLRIVWKVLEGGRQVAGDVWVRRVAVEDQEVDGLAVVETIPVDLDPGRYSIELEVGLPGRDRVATVERDVVVEAIREKAELSSLYFTAQADHEVKSANGDNRLAAFPLVTREVGEALGALTLVGELYAPGGCTSRYRVSYRVVNDRERAVQERALEVPCEGFTTQLALPLDLEPLGFGDYRVELTVEPPTGDRIRREIWFGVDDSRLSLDSNFSRTIEVIEPIASDDEVNALRATSPEEREAAWESFWAERDPDPEAPGNPVRDDFFRRLRHANRHFGTPFTPGWKTDRGFVLLKYGDPDRIERSALSVDRPATEVWTYFDLNRRFVFVSENGTYRLASGL